MRSRGRMGSRGIGYGDVSRFYLSVVIPSSFFPSYKEYNLLGINRSTTLHLCTHTISPPSYISIPTHRQTKLMLVTISTQRLRTRASTLKRPLSFLSNLDKRDDKSAPVSMPTFNSRSKAKEWWNKTNREANQHLLPVNTPSNLHFDDPTLFKR